MTFFNSKFLLFLVGLFLLTVLVFRGVLDNGFVLNWDDLEYVTENPMVQKWPNFFEMTTSFYAANWHPITWLSHALDYQLYGLNPWGHHLTNLLLHGLNTCLVFVLFVLLVGRGREGYDNGVYIGGIFTALLFGLHPLRVESVAWVSERKDLLCGFFFFSTIAAYCTYVREKKRLGYNLLIFFFTLAIMSKPMAVTLPIVLLLLDVFPLERVRLTKDLPPLFIEKIPLFALSLLGGVLTLLAQSATGAVRTLQETSFADRIINSFQTLWAYVEKTFWPRDLLPFYQFLENPSLFSIKFLLGLILFFGVTLFSFYQWRKGNPAWVVAWLFYLITLAPVIGIIKVGAQAMADRYTYIPTLSIAFLSGAGLMNLWQHNKFRSGIILVTAIMAFALSNLSAKQVRIWHDGESLWIPVAEKFPAKIYHAHANLASFYFQEGQLKKAEDQLKVAIKIQPNQVDTLFYLGMVYTDQGRFAEAKELLGKALSLNAKDERVLYRLGVLYEKLGQENLAQNEYHKALVLKPELETVRLRLGQLYSKTGRFKEAEEQFNKVLELNAESEGGRNNLGVLYYQTDRFGQAEVEYLRVIKTWPRKVQAYNNLGILYYETKKYEDAEIIYQKVLELDPNYIEAKNNFGVLNLAMNKNKDALRLLQSSKSMDPKRVDTLYYLGMAYMAERKWLSAQKEFRAALSLNSDNADIYDKIGIVLAQQEKWEKSREAFQSALRLDPSHLSAKRNLQRLENEIIANSQ